MGHSIGGLASRMLGRHRRIPGRGEEATASGKGGGLGRGGSRGQLVFGRHRRWAQHQIVGKQNVKQAQEVIMGGLGGIRSNPGEGAGEGERSEGESNSAAELALSQSCCILRRFSVSFSAVS